MSRFDRQKTVQAKATKPALNYDFNPQSFR